MTRRPDAARLPSVGRLLRDWRARRRVSQMDLALDVDVSPRHLSFVETGRATPSLNLLLALAEGLKLPLRERNQLLVAAGYAPRYAERSWQAEEMAPARAALRRLLDAHDPYPGVALDRQWNVVLSNRAATLFAALIPETLRAPQLNIFRASLHPQGMAAFTANFAQWGRHLFDTLQRAALGTGDAALVALLREVQAYPNVAAALAAPAPAGPPALLLPFELDTPWGRLSLFTTLTTFGSPLDVTIDEVCVELFYPNDSDTAAALRRLA